MKTRLLFIFLLISSINYAQYTFEQIDVWSGSNGGTAKYITEYNGELYFQAFEITPSFKKLYKTDGTVAGTVQVATNLNGGSGYSPQSLIVFKGELFFTAQVAGLGVELYKTDGTEAGTTLLKDIRPGASNGLDLSSDKQIFKIFNNELYFIANTGNAIELWKTDGTTNGTVSVKSFDSTSGAFDARPVYISNSEIQYIGVVYKDEFYFHVTRDGSGSELWKTDGTEAGTTLVRGGLDGLDNLIVFSNSLYFTTADATTGKEIWMSDGTSTGTSLSSDIFPNNLNPAIGKGSNPDDFYVFNNQLFFSARGYDDADNKLIGRELWKIDGTTALAEIVKNINTTIESSTERSGLRAGLTQFITYKNELYFTANDDSDEYDLWKTDGTENGTVKVISSSDIGETFDFRKAVAYNEKLYFFNFQQLWVTDATVNGTKVLTDINGLNSNILTVQTGSLLNYNNKLLFEGFSSANGYEITSLFDTALSTEKFNNESNFSIYPNPATSNINIKSSSAITQLEIYNVLGKRVLLKKYNAQNLSVDVSNLSKGVYIVKAKTDDGLVIKKIIID